MEVIDCLGEYCPIPVIRIKKALNTLESSHSLKVVTDHSCVVQSILSHFRKARVTIAVDEVINGVWEIIITKN